MKWELNEKHEIKIEEINNSKIFIINNFYKNPEEVLNFFKSIKPQYYKLEESNSKNGIFFEDRRHKVYSKDFEKVENYLSNIIKQEPKNKGLILTNQFQFYKNSFNDYKNKHWIPHTDFGYNALVYFDNSETNLYKQILNHDFHKLSEHDTCWIDKKYYEVIYTIKGSYNTCVAFDGKIPHGQNITSDEFINNKRLTQPIFFKETN
jgi:hypothetical protein